MKTEAETEILELQREVSELTEQLEDKIYSICEKLDYQNSSRFSYNIDRLREFNKGLQEFKPINQ